MQCPYLVTHSNENEHVGLVSGESTPPGDVHHFNHNQINLLAATRADPLIYAPSTQNKQDQTLHGPAGVDHATSRDLQHVQQLIVHQVNANANINANNSKLNMNMNHTNFNENQQSPMPLMDHKNYDSTSTYIPQRTELTKPVHHATQASLSPSNKRQRTESKNNIKTVIPEKAPLQRQKTKSQAQIDRRRERNRILARRTRLRKKFFFESLQKEVIEIQKENAALRNIVKTNIADSAAVQTILNECKATKLPDIVTEELGMMAGGMDKQDFCLVRSVKTSQQSFVITDPSLQDNPIVYASDGFLGLTGYSKEAVLGRNCRFLQGTETNKAKVDLIRKSLSEGEDVSVCLLNYTADGTPFWNQLFIAALRDTQNNIVNFIGVTVKVSGPGPDDPESNKVVTGIETMESKGEQDTEENKIGSLESESAEAVMAAAEGTVMAIEGAVSAAVAAAPGMSYITNQ